MLRRSISFASLISLFLFLSISVQAQSDDQPKFEVGIDFSSITKDTFDSRTEAGFGGRLTFNLNKNVALEAATYFFPHRCFNCDRANGTLTEGLFGVKIGKRFDKWGLFGKARPGFASFSAGKTEFVPNPPNPQFFTVETSRVTSFALDLGAVLEFYPTKRIVTRFDAGDTMIHFPRQTTNFPVFDPSSGTYSFLPFTFPATMKHNFQFSAGVGFRF